MGIFEGITHSEEINELLNDAQIQYDNAKNRLESQKKNTTKSLERLGKEKVQAWSKDMNKFLDSFGAFNNVQMVCKIDESYEFLGKNETPNELMVNMQNASYNANEIIKAGALSIGTGALVGIASYGGVAMFANASTGTAIAKLNGAAKKNATLAWFGGGSLSSGGLGIVGGKLILGGVVIGTIAVVGGLIANSKGKAKLAEAKRVHAEAESAVSKMNVVITGMEGIEKVSNSYRSFIASLSGLFSPYLSEMDSIAEKYERGSDGKVDYNVLSEMEQRTLHLSWLLAQLYYHILSVPILNEQGEIDPSSRRLLQKAQQDYSRLSGQVSELENEKSKISELLSNAKREFVNSTTNFYNAKQNACRTLIDIGKRRIELWEKTFSPFMYALSHFENINVYNTYPYNVTDIPIEFIFESCEYILSYIKYLKNNGIDAFGSTGFVEVALFGGEDFLSELSQASNGIIEYNSVHRHDMSLWFTNEMDFTIARNIMFGGVSDNYISAVKQTVEAISNRENLKQATDINQEVMQLSSKISSAIADFNVIIKKINNIENSLKKYNKIQNALLTEIERIWACHQNINGVVHYDLLAEYEKRAFEMSFIIAKMQYIILSSCTLQERNGGDTDDSDIVIASVDNVFKAMKKDAFKMNENNDAFAINVLWKSNADKALVVGFITSAVCIALMILQLVAGDLLGLIGIPAAVIAFPVFFYFKYLSQNKLFMWRCIRIVFTIFLVIVVQIIGMMV